MEILGILVAAIAAFAAVRGLSSQRKTIELQIFESVFKDIRDFEREQHAIIMRNPGQGTDSLEWLQWRELFLQTLEYYCFLANERLISEDKLVRYFEDDILEWYQTIFVDKDKANEKYNPKVYQELKKFVRTRTAKKRTEALSEP